jgi:hypothetical protein
VILLSGPFPFADLFANALVIENDLKLVMATADVVAIATAAFLNIPMHIDD